MSYKLNHLMETISSARIAVIGLGISNIPLIRFLHRAGATDITAYDRSERDEIRNTAASLQAEGMIRGAVMGSTYLDALSAAQYDVIFRGPAVRPDLPQLLSAVRKGALLTSEMELFFALCPCRIYGVTGSDGKTTTTTLIWKLLSAHYAGAAANVWLGGNIGRPLIDLLPEMKPEDTAVVELSSFQLMTMAQSPDVSVITNITPNHLDIHKDYAEYIAAKKNIYRGQKPDGIVILNACNPVTREIAEDCFSAGRRVRLFSAQEGAAIGFDPRAEGHAALEGDQLVYFSSLYNYRLNRDLLRVPGRFNAENLLAAISACADVITQADIRQTVSEFSGVAHRLEFVRELQGVKYYNSSIDSSPNRTIHTLSVFQRDVILIAGGKDKNIPYADLGPAICGKVKILILTGPTAEKIETAVKSCGNVQADSIRIFHVQNYQEAVQCAYDNAACGDTVLLSPASTSFDMFRNFEERGNTFKALVTALE